MYSSTIFQSPNSFVEQSKSIAKHLFEVSTHPNIKRGELYIAFIKDCIIDGYETNAIGIFKSETKDFYLNIKQIYKIKNTELVLNPVLPYIKYFMMPYF
mgnify:CR=1 FL=1